MLFNSEEIDANLTETPTTKIQSERLARVACWMSQDNSEKACNWVFGVQFIE